VIERTLAKRFGLERDEVIRLVKAAEEVRFRRRTCFISPRSWSAISAIRNVSG